MPHPSGRPWIIAHRGASRLATENTLEAFELAVAAGADAVELDVRRTADDHLVVHHDDTLAGSDGPIVAMTRREVAAHAPAVPDLREALDACSDIWVDVEVKNDPRDADWDPDDRVVRAIAAEHHDRDILLTSFNPQSVSTALRLGLRTGLLLGRGMDPKVEAASAAAVGHEFLLPHHSMLDGEHGTHVVEAAQRAGIEIAVWTVNEPTTIRRLAELGVGGIATDVPDVARSALDQDSDG